MWNIQQSISQSLYSQVSTRALNGPGGPAGRAGPENLKVKMGPIPNRPGRAAIERPAIYLRADSSRTYQL